MPEETKPIEELAKEQATKELTEAEKEAMEQIKKEEEEFKAELKMIDDLSEEIFQLLLTKEVEYYDCTKALDQAKVRLTNKLNDIVSGVKMTNKKVKFIVEE